MDTILITGCNGLIGSVVTKRLLKEGYKVIGLSTGGSKININSNFTYIKVDLTDCTRVEEIFKLHKIDTVIHLAAIAHLKGRKNIDWNTFYRVNTLASKNLFKIALERNINVFFASTVDVYGAITEQGTLNENTKVKPISNYAKSKYLAEKHLEKYGDNHNYIIARFAPVYGKGFTKDIYKRIYLRHPDIAFKIGEGYDYHFLSVNNIIEFIIRWVKKPDSLTGITNICDDHSINSIRFLKLERTYTKPKIVLYIPKTILKVIYNVIKYIDSMLSLNILKRVKMNLDKLIYPPKYSNEKMKKIYKPIWDLKSTIYRG